MASRETLDYNFVMDQLAKVNNRLDKLQRELDRIQKEIFTGNIARALSGMGTSVGVVDQNALEELINKDRRSQG